MRYESIEGVLLVSESAAYASLHYPRGMNLEELPFLEQRQGSLTVEIYE